MRGLRRAAALLALPLLLACSGGSDDGGPDSPVLGGTAPTFAPETTQPEAGSTASPTSAPGAAPTVPTAAPTEPTRGSGSATPGGAASIRDPAGDVSLSVDRPPPWADLLGATLTRSGRGYELRIRLGGGTAPRSTDSSHTMNLASFYDLDGDGQVDVQVWANLSKSGWFPAYFPAEPPNRFGDDSEVTIRVAGDEVVLAFPLGHLGEAESFRWSIASEWGTYAVLGTSAMATDQAPDGGAPARFPQ